MHKVAPYGCWSSPINSDLVCQSSRYELGDVAIAHDSLVVYTLADLTQLGHSYLACQSITESPSRETWLTDSSHKPILSHALSLAAHKGSSRSIVFTRSHGQMYGVSMLDLTSKTYTELVPLSPLYRYTDLALHPSDTTVVLAIQEMLPSLSSLKSDCNHQSLVCLCGDKVIPIHELHNVYATPRVSPDGSLLAWVSSDHQSSASVSSSQIWVAALHLVPFPHVSEPVLVAGDREHMARQPVWVPGMENPTLLFILCRKVENTSCTPASSDIYEVHVIGSHDSTCQVSAKQLAGRPETEAPASSVPRGPRLPPCNLSCMYV